MKLEQIQPGAMVYDTQIGTLYRLSQYLPHWKEWGVTTIGRRGEESSDGFRCNRDLLTDRYALWCTHCDGAGMVVEGEDVGPCPDCGGEGLIR